MRSAQKNTFCDFLPLLKNFTDFGRKLNSSANSKIIAFHHKSENNDGKLKKKNLAVSSGRDIFDKTVSFSSIINKYTHPINIYNQSSSKIHDEDGCQQKNFVSLTRSLKVNSVVIIN